MERSSKSEKSLSSNPNSSSSSSPAGVCYCYREEEDDEIFYSFVNLELGINDDEEEDTQTRSTSSSSLTNNKNDFGFLFNYPQPQPQPQPQTRLLCSNSLSKQQQQDEDEEEETANHGELINWMRMRMRMRMNAAAAGPSSTINNPITTTPNPLLLSSTQLPTTYLSNCTPTAIGSGYYSNNFELWNQHLYGSLVSGVQRLGVARREDNSWYLQGGSVYNNYIREEMIQWLHDSPELFIAAAFHETGSSSVQNFIKQLKHLPLAFVATSVLSTKCYELMTDNRGKHVIKQCLLFLGNGPNEVLFEKAIEHCIQLATHKEGCLSLNECISSICGSQRERLLRLITDQSAYLSHDPNGNFVVQHVLSLHNPQFTAEICSRLRDHYSQLSLNQRGSHVVEKCITSSPLGMTYAVQEFLENEKVLCQIARNEFGNYVIQRALKITKVSGSKLYQSLVNTLDAKSLYIGKNRYGRNVINLIRDIIPERRKMVGYRRASQC